MSKQKIKQIIENTITEDGMMKTGIKGVHLFRVSDTRLCAPAIYKPTVVAVLNGTKEAVLDGKSFKYDSSKYMCCTMTMPVEAGTPEASPENPLLGVYISLDTKVMTELAIEMQNASGALSKSKSNQPPPGLAYSNWDETFTEALLRLMQLGENPLDTLILGESRLRELYYAVLKGEAGNSAMRAFGIGNEISRSIVYLSSNLDKAITIEDMAEQVGMSRAVFHRKFKQATSMSPIQFAKSMRLNSAAMRMATGMTVNEAAFEVGYISSSQFSREFKRMYGLSPKQWSSSNQLSSELMRRNENYFDEFQQSVT
ncbi:AraC family transcriptional regulator [Planococcus donghaensis]|uniref:AraC family transcriptional regulator n=1 Tax=Planococcus donghaensis TaxID=414778 RepID=A0A1C7EH59_9BACL|nr:AraC family transcriptional regulator [Planococcus donghaensis]ANU23055.1 AraC family transcriptional regulator [Planococcus donghaensis]